MTGAGAEERGRWSIFQCSCWITFTCSLTPAAFYQYNVTEGLGIAFDADQPETGFDLTLMRDYKSFTENDKKIGDFLFPVPKETLVADPFGRTRSYKPK